MWATGGPWFLPVSPVALFLAPGTLWAIVWAPEAPVEHQLATRRFTDPGGVRSVPSQPLRQNYSLETRYVSIAIVWSSVSASCIFIWWQWIVIYQLMLKWGEIWFFPLFYETYYSDDWHIFFFKITRQFKIHLFLRVNDAPAMENLTFVVDLKDLTSSEIFWVRQPNNNTHLI